MGVPAMIQFSRFMIRTSMENIDALLIMKPEIKEESI